MSLKREEKRKKKEQEKKKRKVQVIARKSAASHFEEAELAYQAGNKEAVVYHLKKILQVKPNDLDALRWIAEVQYNLKHYQEAAYYFERLKQEGDTSFLLNFYSGLAYYYSKTNLDRSLQSLRAFLEETKGKKSKDILEKRKVALYYADLVQHLLPLQSAFQPASKSAGQAVGQSVVQKARPLKEKARAGGSSGEVTGEKAGLKEAPPVAAQKPSIIEAGNFQIHISYSFSSPTPILNSIRENRVESKSLFDLRLEYHHLSLLRGYDELLCLDTLRHVDHYWYQIETARRVLKYYRGRVLLADEVGLGKTIEACMLIKEYLLRGLIRRVLVLTPTSLVSQWHEELSSKFGLDFTTTDQEEFRQNGSFWADHPLVIASLNVAKSKRNFEKITQVEHDLVVVDEAHHLRNRTTLNWKLVNALKRKFVILISATPVQNNLIELFNLITLLKPGFLKTEREFRQKYVASGKPKMPKNSEILRQLLREVMIRNTRSLIDVKLPPRFAATIMVQPSPLEEHIYDRVSFLVRQGYEEESLDRFSLANLQRQAGSSFWALEEPLVKLREKTPGLEGQIAEILDLLGRLQTSEKELRLLELIRKKPGEKKIIFTYYLKTMESLAGLLEKEGIPFARFRGDMSNAQKDQAISDFREGVDILLSTEVGGEGRNIQFCRTIINYDLPWNPMRIEQRIGRVHRIGQTNEVFIFNFCLKESIEEYILSILDRKINMFELVIGEIDNILGNLDEETEFSDLVMDIWARSKTREEVADKFNTLGDQLIEAKKKYLESKELDETLLATDFEV